MADIFNRLLLETKDFDAKLSNSKKGVNDYQGSITNMAKTAGAGVLKFAGAIGVAVTASEAFTKTINSSQTTGDAWVKVQDQMKASVDSFFASIAMGNFDGFLSNLQNVIDKAGDLSVALDNLGTKTLFNNSEVNQLNAQYQIELNQAKKRNISDGDRTKHLENAKAILIKMSTVQRSLASSNMETSYVALQADMAKQGFNRKISKDTWDYLLKDTNRSDVEKRASSYDNIIKNYNNNISKSRYVDKYTGNLIDTDETLKLQKQLSNFKKNPDNDFNRMASVFIQLDDANNSVLASALQMRDKAANLEAAISSRELEIANTDAKINGSYNSQNGNGKSGSGKDNTPSPVGSIAEINAELAKMNKELIEATTAQARIAVQATINELEAKKVSIMVETRFGANKSSKASLSEIAGVINGDTDKTKGSKGLDLKNTKIKSPVSKKDVSLLNNYQEGLYGIGDAMGFLAGKTNEEAASWLNWGASVLNAVSQAIPAIEKLIPALTAKAGAEAIAQTSGAGPLGWIMAGVAVASILASFASLPKFANGGIIEGGSTFGDMNLARVNSGEMILNRGQQSRLFNIINAGEISGNAQIVNTIASTSIRGKDLILVINNELKSRGKKPL